MNKNLVIGILGFSAASITAGCGYLARKVKKLTDKVGLTMKEITETETKDIRESMVEECVRKAAEKSVKRYAQDAKDEALESIRNEVKKKVREAVDDAFEEMKAAVSDEISGQVASIDHQALKKDVTEKAKKKIMEKFDGSLNDLLSEFSGNLNRVKKIYDSVADSISDWKGSDDGKTISFKVG